MDRFPICNYLIWHSETAIAFAFSPIQPSTHERTESPLVSDRLYPNVHFYVSSVLDSSSNFPYIMKFRALSLAKKHSRREFASPRKCPFSENVRAKQTKETKDETHVAKSIQLPPRQHAPTSSSRDNPETPRGARSCLVCRHHLKDTLQGRSKASIRRCFPSSCSNG